jgi:transposase
MNWYSLRMSIASPEIRKIAVEAYLSAKATQQQLADILGFHRTAIVRWIREYKKDGKLEPQTRGHMSKAFSVEENDRLVGMVKDTPDLTLEEIREAFSKKCSLMAVHRELKRLGFRYKKNTEGLRTRTRRHSREQEKMD